MQLTPEFYYQVCSSPLHRTQRNIHTEPVNEGKRLQCFSHPVTKYSRHLWDVPACWYTASYVKILFAQGMLLGPVIFFGKTAIWLLYLQIFSAHRAVRIIVYVGIVVTALTYWTSVPIELAYGCPRPGSTWTDLLTNGMPGHIFYFVPVQGALAVIIDIWIFVLPLPILWRLNMSRRRRIALCAVFFTALL